MNIGERIKDYRKKAGLSQKELGKKLNVSQQHIAQYENGKRTPKLDTIQKIADALSIPINAFLELDQNHTNEEFMQLMELYSQQREELNRDNDIRHHLLIYYYDEMERIGRDSLVEILSNLKILNDIGQKEASKRVKELTEIPRYTQKESDMPDKEE